MTYFITTMMMRMAMVLWLFDHIAFYYSTELNWISASRTLKVSWSTFIFQAKLQTFMIFSACHAMSCNVSNVR